MAAKKMSFEDKLARLEEIVAALEQGDAPLADSLNGMGPRPPFQISPCLKRYLILL